MQGDEPKGLLTVRANLSRVMPTVVYDTYWRFAAARQKVYEARLAGGAGPFTDDPILQRYRFTNCFRAADRVSQDLIGGVIYRGEQAWEEVFFSELSYF